MSKKSRRGLSFLLPHSWIKREGEGVNSVNVRVNKDPKQFYVLINGHNLEMLRFCDPSFAFNVLGTCFDTEAEALAAIRESGEHWILSIHKKIQATVDQKITMERIESA